MENKDIKITLQYNLDEINGLLNLLGNLPFVQVASVVDNIRAQAVPQLPPPENKDVQEVDTGSSPA
jgi:hypothetical protein